jgi:hypothetical protein
MTSFTFSAEQMRSAPPEVRRWIEREVTATLAALSKSEHDPTHLHSAALAACMPQEAAQLFEMIKGNFLLSQVFFELARDTPNSLGAAPLHPLSLGDILRHTRLSDGDRLVDCFTAINQAFQTIRNDLEATLFGYSCLRSPDDPRQHSPALGAVVRCPCANAGRIDRRGRRAGVRRVILTSSQDARRGHRLQRARLCQREFLTRSKRRPGFRAS